MPDYGKAAYELASRKDIEIKNSDLRENPYQTKIGQEVVSVQESFFARAFREGRPRNIFVTGNAAAANTNTTGAVLTASPSCELYPTQICLSCDVDAQLMIKYVTKIADVGTNNTGEMWEVVFLKAGTPFLRSFNGDMKIYEGGAVSIVVNPTSAGKIYGSITGIEVVSNA